jgi:hypothetical protein
MIEIDNETDTVKIQVLSGIKEDFEGCGTCKYRSLPAESCKIAGCIHSWMIMTDMYEKEEIKND